MQLSNIKSIKLLVAASTLLTGCATNTVHSEHKNHLTPVASTDIIPLVSTVIPRKFKRDEVMHAAPGDMLLKIKHIHQNTDSIYIAHKKITISSPTHSDVNVTINEGSQLAITHNVQLNGHGYDAVCLAYCDTNDSTAAYLLIDEHGAVKNRIYYGNPPVNLKSFASYEGIVYAFSNRDSLKKTKVTYAPQKEAITEYYIRSIDSGYVEIKAVTLTRHKKPMTTHMRAWEGESISCGQGCSVTIDTIIQGRNVSYKVDFN